MEQIEFNARHHKDNQGLQQKKNLIFIGNLLTKLPEHVLMKEMDLIARYLSPLFDDLDNGTILVVQQNRQLHQAVFT
ncbi:unnamed protein product [Absidia cylindrospora]